MDKSLTRIIRSAGEPRISFREWLDLKIIQEKASRSDDTDKINIDYCIKKINDRCNKISEILSLYRLYNPPTPEYPLSYPDRINLILLDIVHKFCDIEISIDLMSKTLQEQSRGIRLGESILQYTREITLKHNTSAYYEISTGILNTNAYYEKTQQYSPEQIVFIKSMINAVVQIRSIIDAYQ